MPFLYAEDVPCASVPPPFERALRVMMAPEKDTEVEGFTLIYSTLAPNGGCTDVHSHDVSGELMVFTAGVGKAWLADVEHDVRPGAAMYAPPGVEHRTMNTGSEPLQIVCVFIPPAPADYVREMIDRSGGTSEESEDRDGGQGR